MLLIIEKPYQNISKDRALKIVEILIRMYEQFDFEMSKKNTENMTPFVCILRNLCLKLTVRKD